jgi:hypothetical protein
MYSGELDGAPWTGQAPPSKDDMDTEEESGSGAGHPSKVCVGVCMCVCVCSARKGCTLSPSRAGVFTFHLWGRSVLGCVGPVLPSPLPSHPRNPALLVPPSSHTSHSSDSCKPTPCGL